MKDNHQTYVNGVVNNFGAQATDAYFQWTKCHTKGATGFMAEDANFLNDKIHGHKVEKTGLDNALNGPDRIVDGIKIQTKYFDSASKSVGAAFKDGQYRYGAMKLEVPSDQYDRAVEIFSEKIRQGQVPGVNDPAMAQKMVHRGSFTYEQAKRIAKAGNIESIKFDVKTQAVTCGVACGFSFLVNYATARQKGASHNEAAKAAGKAAVKSGATALAVGVGTQQLLRTQVGRQFAASLTHVSRDVVNAACKTEIGKKAVTKVASAVAGKQVTGAAAKTVMTKAVRGNAIVGAMTMVATTIPDAIDYSRGKISGRQFGENAACNASGIIGGSGGAWAGAAIGTAICPGVGTAIGGFVGSVLGGIGASSGVRSLFGSRK